MQLTEEALKEFKEIYKRVFGADLDDQTALDIGTRLIVIMKAIYKPMPDESDLSEWQYNYAELLGHLQRQMKTCPNKHLPKPPLAILLNMQLEEAVGV